MSTGIFEFLFSFSSGRKDFSSPPQAGFFLGGGSGRRAAPPPACLSYFLRFLFFDLWIKFGKIRVKVCRVSFRGTVFETTNSFFSGLLLTN